MLRLPRCVLLVVVAACSSGGAAGPTVPPVAPNASSEQPAGAPADPTPRPPRAEQRPYAVQSPNGTRNDPYYWLRDDQRKDPAVLGYLEAENAYTKAMLAPTRELEDTLFAEMRGRIKEDDSSVPMLKDGYWYYRRFEIGKQHPIYARRKATMQAAEQIVLDGNQLAEGHGFYTIGSYAVSRDGALVAWADDTVGRRQYTLHVKNLATGAMLPDTADNISPQIQWANDHKTLFYVGKDPVTLREDRIVRIRLGGTAEQVFKEDDGSYYVGLGWTKSRRYIQIELSATTNTEVRLIDANKPMAAPQVFLPRSKDHLYSIDHLDGRFLIRTNADAKNFRVVQVREGKQADRKAWKDVIAHRGDALVESFVVYRGFVAASVRTGGLRKIEVLPANHPAFFLDAQDPTYAMDLIDTPDPSAKRLRYGYDSMVVPTSVFELDVASKQRDLLKQFPVPGYDPTNYTSEYVHATARDGTKVPISVVYKKDTPRDGSAPLLITGYGSYGSSYEPGFSSSAVSLLDRGWIYAIAHIRGGEEMGRAWYEDGKLMHKMNTFNDFIAATEHLVEASYAARDQVCAEGGSAGGLLMGAVMNLRPDLYRCVVAQVPFVDVVTTMLDESIPLTTNEFDEWGNPKDKAAYDYMLAYSPYDNVKPTGYPALLVQTGLWDSQVQYFEPAKWIAKLRATKTDDNLMVLETDMTSGHGGASGRFDKLRQVARAHAFMLYVRGQPDLRQRSKP
ncbi:MAG: S9 family peptidase [Kofleriaceae bacterium]